MLPVSLQPVLPGRSRFSKADLMTKAAKWQYVFKDLVLKDYKEVRFQMVRYVAYQIQNVFHQLRKSIKTRENNL